MNELIDYIFNLMYPPSPVIKRVVYTPPIKDIIPSKLEIIELVKECKEGKTDLADKIIDKYGIDKFNLYCIDGVLFAAQNGYLKTVKYFIKQGIDINAINHKKNNALICAAWKGQAHIVHYLLCKGAEPNPNIEKSIKGLKCNADPILFAIDQNDFYSVKLLHLFITKPGTEKYICDNILENVDPVIVKYITDRYNRVNTVPTLYELCIRFVIRNGLLTQAKKSVPKDIFSFYNLIR